MDDRGAGGADFLLNNSSASAAPSDFLAGGGEMGALMRAHDWSASPLGPPAGWPQSLRSVAGLLLNSKFPMFVAWGPELGFLYNDAYREILGAKHPAALGARFENIWHEIWSDISPLIDAALAGEATYREDLPLLINRKGFDEQTWFTFSYSPVRDESGVVAGMFCACSETTAKVAGEKRSAAELERLAQMFRQAPGAVALLRGPDHVFEIVNPAYERLVGRSDLIGKSASEALPEVVGQGFIALLDSVFQSGQPYVGQSVPIMLQRGAGEPAQERLVDFVYQPMFDSQGATTGIFAQASDVTERARAEAALRESEARLRALTDHLPGGMVYQIDTGPDGGERRFLYVSQSHEALTGIPAEKVLADPTIPYQLIHPDDRPLLAEAEAEAIRTGRLFDVQARFRRADGELRWCRIISAPREQSDGSRMWDGIQIDITDQKETETALRESEARSQAIANSIDQMIWSTRPDGYHDYFNRRWYEYTGMPEGSTDGEEWNGLFHPDDQERAWQTWRHSLATGETYHIEYRLRHRSGQYRWVLGRAQPVRDEAGRITRWFGTCTDIEEIVEAREVLHRSREELEAMVAERTAALVQAQEQLRQSQKLEAMGQLTGGVAHDFNNLLTPIVGSLDLLQRRGIGSEREQRLIEGALQSAERAKTLVQRLLAFARRQPLQPRPVDIGALVAGMAQLVASTSGPQVKVAVDIPEDLPAATADPNQLEMAILNLSVNARDAMPDGGSLTIAARMEEVGPGHRTELNPGRYVRLSVADTGSGMDEATIARAVEPFFSTKGIGRGTGLGLSMVHGLASQLGGALTITSRVGLGTDIELWLPATDQLAETDGEQAENVVQANAAGTALLVDDEPLVRASTADMLTELGYEVVEAGSAEEALKILRAGTRIDLILTDHLMPGMTGADLAREVQGAWPATRVVIISGYADADALAPDLPRLSKPFRRADLAEMLAEIAVD